MMLDGSDLINQHKAHVQDPYSFRCIPQVHGASKDAVNHVASVLSEEINAVTDNPTIFPDEDLVISGGNFHGQPLALALDYLAIAVSEWGNISERRTFQLISGSRGLPSFLVANPGLHSGFMIPQYTAASIVNQNKQLCTPASVDSIVSSQGQEDHVSMGANAATKAWKTAQNLERILAIELFNAAQALEFRRPLKSSPYLERFVAQYREQVSFVEHDKIMHDEIEKSIAFLQTVVTWFVAAYQSFKWWTDFSIVCYRKSKSGFTAVHAILILKNHAIGAIDTFRQLWNGNVFAFASVLATIKKGNQSGIGKYLKLCREFRVFLRIDKGQFHLGKIILNHFNHLWSQTKAGCTMIVIKINHTGRIFHNVLV